MRDLRELILVPRLLLACLCVLTGCLYVGPGWVAEFGGRVVDPVYHRPLAGALVFRTLWIRPEPSRMRAIHTSWARSGSDGRFVIPAQFDLGFAYPSSGRSFGPLLSVYHPEYGLARATVLERATDQGATESFLEFKVERFFGPEDMKDPSTVVWSCSFFMLTKDGCEQLCEATVGMRDCEAARDRDREALGHVL